MAACSTWKYTNITPAVFRTLQSVGRQKGFMIPGTPTGSFTITVAGMQVGFGYSWDSRSSSLMLTCMNKPVLLGCSTIKSFADKIVAESGGRPA